MPTIRRADVEWIGGFVDGEGKILRTTSGALPRARRDLDVAGRRGAGRKTSPEELLAAAHASCFAMQFTSGLVGAGWEPEEMQVTCEISFEVGIGDHGVGPDRPRHRPGLTDEQIYEIAQRAKIMCPISRALAAIEVTLELPELVLEQEEDEAAGAGADGVATATEE